MRTAAARQRLRRLHTLADRRPSIAGFLLLSLLGCATALAADGTPPAAKSVPATDTYPGFTVVDPYRNLEDLKDADTQAWMKAQAEHARKLLDAIPERARIRAALDVADAMRDYSTSGIDRVTDQRLFYTRREANAATGKLYVRDGDSGTGRVVFDPARFDSEGKTHTISWKVPSPSGKRIAVGVAANGSEQAEFYVIDVDSGKQLEGPIPRSWLGIAIWLDEDRLLLGRMREATPGMSPAEVWLDSQVFLHRIGTPIGDDVHVFGTQSQHKPEGLPPQDFVGVFHRPGEPYVVGVGVGARAYYSAWTMAAADLGKPDARWRQLFLDDAKNKSGSDLRNGQLYAISDQHPNGEIVHYDLASGERHVLRPAGERPIESIGIARDGIYFRERTGVYTALKRIGYDGKGEAEIRFPRQGVPSPGADWYANPALDGAVVYLDSWTQPSTDFLVSADGSVRELGLSAPVRGIDLGKLHARNLVATSHDGTAVPLSLQHYGELKPAKQQQVMLVGYGSYGFAQDPIFVPLMATIMQEGLAVATCHVRGGGEFGSAWHEGGKLATKPNTWKDFIACAEALVTQGITVPAKLVGMGTSAGGITISNALNERPDLFAGAVNNVGVSDVLRSLSASQNGPNHYAENGDIRTAEGAAIARAMSGYERIEDGKAYPPWLVIHGVNDPRVEVWQSNKFAARMQAASANPVIYRLDYATGHGVGSSSDARDDLFADITAFVLDVTRDKGD